MRAIHCKHQCNLPLIIKSKWVPLKVGSIALQLVPGCSAARCS